MTDKNGLLVLFFALYAIIAGSIRASRLKKLSQQTSGWATTRGKVLEAKIVGFGRHRYAQILYEYKAPAPLIGSRICSPGCEENNPDVYLRFYRVGKEINVHYDPNDPRQCLLELPSQRIINSWRLLMVIGVVSPVLYVLWLEYLKV